MVGELRCYPPSSSDYWRAQPASIEIEQAANYPAQLTASVTSNWERHADEDDTNNPLQRGAYIEYWEDQRCYFRGKVKRVSRAVAGGTPAVEITALDKLQVLNETFAVYNGSFVWSRSTPPLALTAVTLQAAYDYGDGLRFVWWPDPASSAWISDGASNSTTLGAAMADATHPPSGDPLKLSQHHSGLPPAGFLKVGSEWIEYNGYAWDPADQYWYAHSIRRGALGTTAAAHAAGATVYGKLCKRIDPRGRVKIEGNNAGTWELIQVDNHVAPQWESGSFAFSDTPTALGSGGAAYSALRGTWTSFDEEGGSVLHLSDVLNDVLTVDPLLGGPGFGGGFTDSATVNITLSIDPVLTRAVVPKKTRALAFIKGLLEEIGIARGQSDDAAMLRYDPDGDVVELVSVAQGTPSRTYHSEAQRLEEVTSEGLSSAVLVEYQQGTPFNLVSSPRIWHTVVGLSGSGSPPGGAVPAAFQKIAGTWHGPLALAPIGTYNFSQEIVPGVSGAANLLTDNDETSGLALLWDTLQAASVHFYAWFPGATAVDPDEYFITKLVASFDLTGAGAGVSGGSVADIDFEFVVFDSFTGSVSTAAPTAGTSLPLSVKATVQFSAGSVNQQLRVEADIPYVAGRAIGIKVNGYFDANGTFASGGFRYGFALNELAVYGVQVRHELVQLKAAYSSADSNTLVDVAAAGKLLDTHMGQYDHAETSIGTATREVARNMGWLTLLQKLAQSVSRSYVLGSRAIDREGVAIPGETCAFEGGKFSGVADTVTYSVAAGRRMLTVRAVDYGSAVTGGPGVTCAVLPPPRNAQLRRSEEIRRAAGVSRFIKLQE